MHRRYGMLFSIAVFDLDNFKIFNEANGLTQGDRLLKQVAALLDQQARDTDLVTRSGGEEFIVVLPGTELAGATMFARANAADCGPLDHANGECRCRDGGRRGRYSDVFDAGRFGGMYAAKAAGRNAVIATRGKTFSGRLAGYFSAGGSFDCEKRVAGRTDGSRRGKFF